MTVKYNNKAFSRLKSLRQYINALFHGAFHDHANFHPSWMKNRSCWKLSVAYPATRCAPSAPLNCRHFDLSVTTWCVLYGMYLIDAWHGQLTCTSCLGSYFLAFLMSSKSRASSWRTWGTRLKPHPLEQDPGLGLPLWLCRCGVIPPHRGYERPMSSYWNYRSWHL